MHPDGYGQAEDDEKDAQDHRGPAECQARQRQARSLFSGALDLAAGYVAAHDRRDRRQRPEGELCASPQARLAMASPLVLATGVTAVVLAAVVTTVAGATGRSVTTWSRSA